MSAVLISILAAIVNGQSIAAALGAVTTAQWLTLSAGVVGDLAPDLIKILGLPAQPSLGAVIDSVVKVASDDVTRKAVSDWLSANANAALAEQPGMGEH